MKSRLYVYRFSRSPVSATLTSGGVLNATSGALEWSADLGAPVRVDVLLDLSDPPEAWTRLGHGYRVEVAVLLHDREVLSLPLGALFREGQDWKVFRLEEGRGVWAKPG